MWACVWVEFAELLTSNLTASTFRKATGPNVLGIKPII